MGGRRRSWSGHIIADAKTADVSTFAFQTLGCLFHVCAHDGLFEIITKHYQT